MRHKLNVVEWFVFSRAPWAVLSGEIAPNGDTKGKVVPQEGP